MQEGDQIDRANELADREREAAIETARRSVAQTPAPTGRCFYCDEIVDDERRWCSVECARDWEREAEARKRNGQ